MTIFRNSIRNGMYELRTRESEKLETVWELYNMEIHQKKAGPDYLAPIHSVKWHPPVCLFYKSENGCRFGEKCSYAHRQVEEKPSKRSKKNGDNSAVAMLKRNEQPQRTGRPVLDAYSSSTRQLGCVFQDMEPPKSSSILRKSSHIRKPNPMCKMHKSRRTSC